MKLIKLMYSDWQPVKTWKRYYVFEPGATVVDTLYESTKHTSGMRYISPTDVRINEEVMFDYYSKRVVAQSIISMFHSNIRVQQLFKTKYEFTFSRAYKVSFWFARGKRRNLKYPVEVVANVAYILNTNTSELRFKNG